MTGAKGVPVLDIWRRYIETEPKQKGQNYWARCPFHADKTPSLSIDLGKCLWHCFSCGAGGSAIDLVMALYGLSYKEACGKIEEDFRVQQGWIPTRRVSVKSQETLISERIQQVFDWVFEARRALHAELKRRGDDVSEIIIRDIGRLEIIEDELVGEPDRIANGLILHRRWFPWQQQLRRF